MLNQQLDAIFRFLSTNWNAAIDPKILKKVRLPWTCDAPFCCFYKIVAFIEILKSHIFFGSYDLEFFLFQLFVFPQIVISRKNLIKFFISLLWNEFSPALRSDFRKRLRSARAKFKLTTVRWKIVRFCFLCSVEKVHLLSRPPGGHWANQPTIDS